MPTFIFVSGLTIPLSITRRLEQGEARSVLYLRIARRLLILMVLNVILYGALNHYDWNQMRFMGVLARIALSWSLAAVIVMHTTPQRQAAWAIGILIGYWAAITLMPVPGFGRGILTPEASLTSYLDRYLLPGQIMGGIYDRLGLYSILPTVSTVLIGALAGHWLLTPGRTPLRKALVLLAAGVVSAGVGMACSRFMPINTKFWSPTLVLAAGGWSLIYLGVFYLVIDACGLRRWAIFFVVIGMNSITIYVLQTPVSFEEIARFFFGGAIGFAPVAAQAVLAALSVLALKWLLLCWLYRRRIFLRA
jgi:predicted acyltransferase